jgi:hypothetical protein
MPRPRLQTTDAIVAGLDEVARLLAISLRREKTLQETIEEFDAAGIQQARIAELLDTSSQYVSVALSRAKSKKQAAAKPRTHS